MDDNCRRNCERIDALEIQYVSEHTQELEPVHEAEGETEYDSGGGVWDPSVDIHTSSELVASSSSLSVLLAPRDIPFSQSVTLLPGRPVPKKSGPQYFKASPPAEETASDDDEQFQKWYEKKLKKIFKQHTENDDDIINYRKQLIPDAFAIQPLPGAAGFDSWINTLITKAHAASHGIDAAREWIAIVKRDPDIEKYQSAEKFEALDIKLASALKPVLTRKLQILVNQKERALELTNGKPLRGRQILCMIIDHYQINTNDKDFKNITDLNNVTLRGDDILGFIT